MSTTLYLVRHAHADWQPSEARPLSARGRASAQRLAGELADVKLAAIYSSPSRRALETIEPLADRLQIQPVLLADLRERKLTAPSAAAFEAAVQATWRDFRRPYPGGESNAAAQARGVALVRRLLRQHRDERVMLATHGSLLALIVNGFDSTYGYDFWRTFTFPDVYELTFRGDVLKQVRRRWEHGEP